jgi:capsule polysaccharide export protein KpsE/RkpR
MTPSQANVTETVVLLDLYRKHIHYLYKYGVGILAVIFIISLFMPQKFVADAAIMPPEAGSTASSNLASLLSAAPISLAASGAEAKTALLFMEIMRSRTLRENVIDSLSLEASIVFRGMSRYEIQKTLEKATSVEIFKTGKVAVEIQVSTHWFPSSEEVDSARRLSAQIANAFTAELDRMNRSTSTLRARRTRAYLERVIAQTLQATAVLQDSLQQFQQANKVLGLREQLELMASNASAVGAELAKERLILTLMQQEYQPESAPIRQQRQKVATLERQYEMIQHGGIVSNDELSIPAEKLPALSREYMNIMRDLKTNEQVLAYLQSQRMQEVVQEERDVPTVVLLDSAVEPPNRTSPSRFLMMVVSSFVIVALYLIVLPMYDSFRRRMAAANV